MPSSRTSRATTGLSPWPHGDIGRALLIHVLSHHPSLSNICSYREGRHRPNIVALAHEGSSSRCGPGRPSNNAHRVRRIWFSPGRDGRVTSCSRFAGSGRRTPAAATRWIRCPTASPDTPYRAPISRSAAGGACPNPAQSNTDLARSLRGSRTRQMSCETTSGTVLPGNGAASPPHHHRLRFQVLACFACGECA